MPAKIQEEEAPLTGCNYLLSLAKKPSEVQGHSVFSITQI
jgi:hypothetical protein